MASRIASFLRYGLGALYTLAGFAKLQTFNAGVHDNMLKDFNDFAKAFPLIRFGYSIEPAQYMFAVGVVELLCGLLLVLGPSALKRLSCLVLAGVMVGAAHSLYVLEKPPLPFPICCAVGLMYVYYSLVTEGHTKQE